MPKKIRASELPEFDLAEHLKTTDDIAAYLTMVMDDGDASEFAHALGVAARAKGMTEVARAAGMTREGLYKALRPDSQPRFETVLKVCKALGVHLHATGDDNSAAA
jgi:probable addiction module antidote protein